MSQKDEADLQAQLQKTEAARAKAAKEWDRIDATLYSSLPQGKKLAVLSHLRRTNSGTGVQWASASYHAQAMGVSTKQAERTMRALREDGVLEEVDRKEGGTVTVKLKSSWIEETERQFLAWKLERRSQIPRTSKAGVENEVEGPRPPTCLPPAAHVPTPRPPTCPYPLIDPPSTPSDLAHPTGEPEIPTQVVPADESKSSDSEVGAELQLQEPEVVLDGFLPWVDPAKIPKSYDQAVWFDRALGKLFLVHNEKGRAFFRGLRDDFEPEVIRQGLTAACAKAPAVKARNGGYEALVRTYCGYALEKQEEHQRRSTARETAFQRPRMFQP